MRVAGPMVQFSSVLFAQIRFLVANLYKKIAKNNIAELNHVRSPPPTSFVNLITWCHPPCALRAFCFGLGLCVRKYTPCNP